MFDYVHDVQNAYRKLVDAVAKPGIIKSLKVESEKLDFPVACCNATLVLLLMLLDTEVTFHILGKDQEKITSFFSQLTYARPASLETAEFIVVLENSGEGSLTEAIRQCKPGDLINPHLSATLLVETAQITGEKCLSLRGPGIPDERYISVSATEDWVAQRAIKNAEYPLGVDMYFIDRQYNLLAIPRTTVITIRG